MTDLSGYYRKIFSPLWRTTGGGERRTSRRTRPGYATGWKRSFPTVCLRSRHADLVVSDPHAPHMKVAISPLPVRELDLRPVGDDDPAVGGPPVHDRDALGTTRVGPNQEVRAFLGVLVAALGSVTD